MSVPEERPSQVGPETAIGAGIARQAELAENARAVPDPAPALVLEPSRAHHDPAADGTIGRKAVEGGTAPMARILQRYAFAPAELADRVGRPW